MVSEKAIDSLRELLGNQNFTNSISAKNFFSKDLFYEGLQPLAIISPTNINDLRKCIIICKEGNLEIIPRGGGLSYTAGYLKIKKNNKNFILFDMRKINRIIEINTENLTATVEPGCTWEDLYIQTSKSGLRPKMFGPSTGKFSTIGGSVTNNCMFFGSASAGTSSDSVLGLDIMSSNGEIIKTGSGSIKNGKAFYRNNGPDITGVFLNDGGIMGIKIKITLLLEQIPKGEKHLSLSFDSIHPLIEAIINIGRSNLTSECIAIIPSILGDESKKIKPSLHIVTEGWSKSIAEIKYQAILEMVETISEVSQIDPIIPKYFREKMFDFVESPLDSNGKLQIWTHGVFPFDQIEISYKTIRDIILNYKNIIKAEEISVTMSFALAGNAVMIEPVITWTGNASELHLLGMKNNAKHQEIKANQLNASTKPLVHEIRNAIEKGMSELGAAHMQYGRFYKFAHNNSQSSVEFIKSIKTIVDPSRLFNPGALDI